MNKWRLLLKEQGLKVTPQRLTVLQTLAEFDDEAHPGAEEIWECIQLQQPDIPKATVYRILKSLSEIGIVNELYLRDGKSRYEINEDHHHHFVCLSCRNIEKILGCPGILFEQIGKTRHLVSHNFEMFGYCSDCNRKKGAK